MYELSHRAREPYKCSAHSGPGVQVATRLWLNPSRASGVSAASPAVGGSIVRTVSRNNVLPRQLCVKAAVSPDADPGRRPSGVPAPVSLPLG